MARKPKQPTLGAEHLGLNVIVTEHDCTQWLGQLVQLNVNGSAYVKPASGKTVRDVDVIPIHRLSLAPNDHLYALRNMLVELTELLRDPVQYAASRSQPSTKKKAKK